MQIRNFSYKKDNGETSQRRVLMFSEPSDNYLGLDISNLADDDLTEDDLETLIVGLKELDMERKMLINNLGFVNRWRQFKPSGIEWTSD